MSKISSETSLNEENRGPQRKLDVTEKVLRKLRKKSGLKATLDCTLEPRLSAGRPKGCGNYQWTPGMDEVLKDLFAKLGESPRPAGCRALPPVYLSIETSNQTDENYKRFYKENSRHNLWDKLPSQTLSP